MIDWDNLLLTPTHDAFGEQVTYYPASGAPRRLTVVFNEAYTQVTMDEGQVISSTGPVLNVRASILPRPPEMGDLWNVRGVLYQTIAPKPDGLGDIRVDLRVATNDQVNRVPLPPIPPATT